METISERDVAQKTYLNKKPLKFKIMVISIILSIILSSFLIWAYAFKGLLYLEYKNISINYYESIVLSKEYSECDKLKYLQAQSSCKGVIEEQNKYYDWQMSQELDVIKFTSLYEVDSVSSKNNIIFAMTNTYFIDKRESNKISKVVFFIYKKQEADYNLYDIVYMENDLDKIKEYKK